MCRKLVKAVLILFSVAFVTNAYSQVWCPAGATWYYADVSATWDGYSKFTYLNDTIINSITCKKITHFYEGAGPFGYKSGYNQPYFTYSQNDVAYLFNNKYGSTKFDTLFNINAQIGDKWRFPLVDTTCADSLFFMNVLNTGIKTVNGFNLKWLFVKIGPFDNSGGGNFTYRFDTITERLGCRYDDNDYAPCYGSTAEGSHGGLRCYSDDIFGSYSTGISSSCDYYYTNISELQIGSESLKIYPNPANSKINIAIHIVKGQTATLEIYDLTGKLMLLSKFNGSIDILEISTTALSDGMYIYKLDFGDNNIRSGKLSIIR